MNRTWLRLTYAAIALLIMVVAYDIFVTLSGLRSEFVETLTPVNPTLIPSTLQQHFQSDPNFAEASKDR